MGVTVIHGIRQLSENLKPEKFEPVMRKISKYLVSSAVKKIDRGISPANAPLTQAVKQGNKTLYDNGQLIPSIAPQNGNDWAAAQTNLKYAHIQQKGGTITGKKKGLWLPAGARTRTLSRQYNSRTAGELISSMRSAGYSFFRVKNVFFAKPKKGKPFPLFVIKRSVKIPARPFLFIDDADAEYINSEIKKAVHAALEDK